MSYAPHLVFITNIRDGRDLPLYKKHPLYGDGKNFVKPDIYEWKNFFYTNTAGNLIKGTIILIGSTVEEIVKGGRQNAIKQTWQAIDCAKNILGVSVIGFGINTKTLIKPAELPKDILFTHGDSLTAAVSLQQFKNAAKKCEIDLNAKETKVMIVGAYGIIGKFLAKNLAKSGCSLLIVGKDSAKLAALQQEIGSQCKSYLGLNSVEEKVDVVITATNHSAALLQEEDVKKFGPNLLIFDVAQPPNVSYGVCNKFKDQIIRVDGAIMAHNNMNYDDGESGAIGFGPKEFPACLGETMVIATALNDLKGKSKVEGNDFIREVKEENSSMLLDLAGKYGFEIPSFTCYKRIITESDFENFKQNKNKNRI